MKHGPVSWKYPVFDRLFTAWVPQSHWRVIGKFIEVVSDAAQLSSEIAESCDLRRVCNMMSYHWRAGQKSCEFNILRFAQPSNAGRYRLWSQKLFMAGVFCVYTLPYTIICEMGQWWDWKPSWQVNAESEKVSFEKEVAKVWWPCWCIHRTFATLFRATHQSAVACIDYLPPGQGFQAEFRAGPLGRVSSWSANIKDSELNIGQTFQKFWMLLLYTTVILVVGQQVCIARRLFQPSSKTWSSKGYKGIQYLGARGVSMACFARATQIQAVRFTSHTTMFNCGLVLRSMQASWNDSKANWLRWWRSE